MNYAQSVNNRKLCVCCIHTLDRRWVDAGRAPFVQSLLANNAWSTIRTIPSTDLLPTIITGTLPHVHQIWQVSLKSNLTSSPLQRFADRLPDLLTTTVQCFQHFLNPNADLPAMPRWRRRQFNVHRTKFIHRARNPEVINRIGGVPSIFGILGDKARFHFVKDFDKLDPLEKILPTGDKALEFLELYALDLFSHWNYYNDDAIGQRLIRVDTFLKQVHQRCQDRGVQFILLVDHGQSPVQHKINLKKHLKATGIPRREYTYILEVASARFWFKTDRARTAITSMLKSLDHVNVHTRREMFQFDVKFETDDFCELYAITDQGHVYFPHDFYQPLANAYMAFTHEGQRPRLRRPWQQGYHGHLPNHPAEQGYCVIAEPNATSRVPKGQDAKLIDIAPTVLDYLGVPIPQQMTGQPLFQWSP